MSSKNQQNSHQYSAKNIKALSPREHIRLRPGMYIGGTDKRALHHMVYEVLDNSIEEVMFGLCDDIRIELRENRIISISDNSQSLPVSYQSPTMPKTWLELIMTSLANKPRFNGYYYGVSGGLHGVGLSVVNALSEHCTVETKTDGYLWKQAYKTGIPTSEIEKVRPLSEGESSSTRITFLPDYTILENNEVDFDIIARRCEDLAYLFPSATFTVCDMRGIEAQKTFHFPNGIVDWVEQRNCKENKLTDVLSAHLMYPVLDKLDYEYEIGVELAFQYIDSNMIIEQSFLNSVPIPNGGTHLVGLQKAICTCIWQEGQKTPDWDDVGRGFVGMINLLHPDPQFESPTKVKLLNPDVSFALIEAVKMAFRQNPVALAQIREHFATHNA